MEQWNMCQELGALICAQSPFLLPLCFYVHCLLLASCFFCSPVHHRQINGPMCMINTQLPALVTHVMSLTSLKLVYTLFNQASSVGQVHLWMFQ